MGNRSMGNRRRTIAAAVATILTSTGLYPIFSGGGWFWAGAGAALTIAGAGALTRLRRLPVPVCLLASLVALLLYLNLVFAHGQSLAGLLPTPSSLTYLWELARQGTIEAGRYAPPVPELPGMVLLAAGGVGLTALLVDFIAVRLRSAAFAGLPLLLVFTAPFTLSVSRSWLGTTTVFCFAAAGYLTLLGNEGRERIREWGQPESVAVGDAVVRGEGTARGEGAAGLSRRISDEAQPPDTRALAAAGRRVGAASVVVALCVPLFVPGLHVTRLFGSGHPGIGGRGGFGGVGSVGFPDPQTQISGELRNTTAKPVLSYTSTAAEPDYLQVYVLGDLTADHGWQFSRSQPPSPADPTVPDPPGLTTGTATLSVTTHIAVSKQAGQDALVALPTPYPPVRVDAGGNVQVDHDTLMLFDNGAQLAGLDYSVTSLDVVPAKQALAVAPAAPNDIKSHYLDVPQSYDSLRAEAESITANATTPYAKAVALQEWFANGNFGYSLAAPTITDATGLKNFIDSTRSGYCQQFSFAMAVMARMLGIPSRVAYGFTQGTRQHDGSWRVTTHDAHAWPELYFQGAGWLRFEPTPGGATGQGTATAPAYTAPQSGPTTSTSAAPLPNPAGQAGGTIGNKNNQAALHNHQLLQDSGNGGAAVPVRSSGGPNPWELAGLSLLGLLALTAILPGCARAGIRRRRWWRAARLANAEARADARAGDSTGTADTRAGASADAALADAAWHELCDDLTDYRAGYLASESPRALARRIIGELELPADAADALRRVTMAAERARYSARPASGATLRHDSATVRHAVAASVPRRTRWLALVFPSSVVGPAVFVLGQATDVFGRFGSGRPKIGIRRLRGRTDP
ncbi:MAG TPA: DUF3488 and transglutaminase-like domain-containing protein [Trebonia sp.]